MRIPAEIMALPKHEPASRAAHRAPSYSRQWTAWITVLLALDAFAVWGSLNLAYVVRISSGWLEYQASYNADTYRWLTLAGVLAWLGLFAAFGLYRRDNLLGGLTEYQQVIKACTGGTVALVVLSFMWHDPNLVSRGWLLLAWGLSCGLLGLERFLARRLAYGLRRRGWFTARVLIVGVNDQSMAIARQWARSSTSGMQVVGFMDDFTPVGTPVLNGLKVVGRPTSLGEMAHRLDAREVVVVPNAIAWETFEEIIAGASAPNGYIVRLSPGFYEFLTTGVAVTNKTFVPLFTVNEARLVGADAFLKALLDYGLGIPLLVLAAPFMGAIALGLRLSGKGRAVLARHLTVGQQGRRFAMLKFNAGRAGGRTGSRLEGALYRSGLDKLPQLLNVLAGQMSLVGPRPRVVGSEETDLRKMYNLQTVKPGLIGPWTVTGHWTSSDEIRDELYYVRNWTIWLDLQILLQSALSLATAGGQARPGPKRRRV